MCSTKAALELMRTLNHNSFVAFCLIQINIEFAKIARR